MFCWGHNWHVLAKTVRDRDGSIIFKLDENHPIRKAHGFTTVWTAEHQEDKICLKCDKLDMSLQKKINEIVNETLLKKEKSEKYPSYLKMFWQANA